ncbi:MAG TPA: hypothetical protein VGE57_10920 [Solimonas sp.]
MNKPTAQAVRGVTRCSESSRTDMYAAAPAFLFLAAGLARYGFFTRFEV